VIKGLHVVLYSEEADAVRRFFRDQLRLPHGDAGDGWLIFVLPEAELAAHPVAPDGEPPPPGVSLYCEDLDETVRILKERGVEFVAEGDERAWGRVARLRVPGGPELELYEPKYDLAN
jgi:hypothetical protein